MDCSAEVTFKERPGQARYTSKVTKAAFLDSSSTICQQVQRLGKINGHSLGKTFFCCLWFHIPVFTNPRSQGICLYSNLCPPRCTENHLFSAERRMESSPQSSKFGLLTFRHASTWGRTPVLQIGCACHASPDG